MDILDKLKQFVPKFPYKDAAPEVDQEPVAFRILRKNFDDEWVDDHRCWCNGKPDPNLIEDIAKRSDRWRIEYSYAIHPDAQAEIAKRDERITELERAIDNEMVVSHIGVFDSSYDPKEALNKLQCYAQDLGAFFAQNQLKEQAAEISRLKGVVAKAGLLLEPYIYGQFADDFDQPLAKSIRKNIRELCEAVALAAIKEIEHD